MGAVPYRAVAHQGCAQVGKVYPNLVGAAGFQLHAQQGAAALLPQGFPVGHRPHGPAGSTHRFTVLSGQWAMGASTVPLPV